MREPKSIVWLASYPGSGNTWLRVFLSNLLANDEAPANINALTVDWHAASRGWFDTHAGIEASDLRDDEVEEMRPAVYEAIAAEHAAPFFIKIHDAFGYTPSGQPLISSRVTRGVIYIVRDPLDVAVSYAYNRDVQFDVSIRIMADEDHSIAGMTDGIVNQLKQRLGSWSTHVRSWVDDSGLPVHVVRYEDMKNDPMRAFGAAADFAEIACTRMQLERAIEFSAFAEMRAQEDAGGFNGRSRRARRFFRRGETGSWRDELTPAQAQRILATHDAVRRRFGYLDSAPALIA